MNPARWPLSSVKYTASGFKSARMDWMVAPSFPAFAAAFPDSTGMLTFTKNRIGHLLDVLGSCIHGSPFDRSGFSGRCHTPHRPGKQLDELHLGLLRYSS